MLKALRSHKFYIPLITVASSVALFLVYYFFYVSWQRTYANDRAFRLLATVGDQMVERFANLRNLYAAALVSGRVPQYLNQYLKGEISNIQFDGGASCSDAKSRDGALSLQLKGTVSLVLATRFVPAGPSAGSCTIAADVDLRPELTQRFHDLTEEYFDDILIAAPSGQVLFQKNGSALRIFNLNALLPGSSTAAKPAASSQGGATEPSRSPGQETNFQKATQFSQVLDVKLAGSDYQLFIQPLAVSISDQANLPIQPVICGLWRSDRFQSEVVSFPYTALIWGTLVVLAMFALVWPLLKVVYMSHSERLRRRHVFYLLFSCLFLTTVLTAIVLNTSYTLRGDEESREQLDALADRIEANVKAELERSLRLLNNVGRDESLHRELIKTGGNWKPGQNFLTPGFFRNNTPLDYPYFDNIFWVDESGQQQYRVTVQASATPAISVQDKNYFQSVRDERRLSESAKVVSCSYCHTSARLPADLAAASDARFRVEPVYSRNTGEFFVVLARAYRPEWSDLPPPLTRLSAQVLLSKFLSLVDPVVAPGFGYAILNRDGLVQFHSSSARNLVENFFTECRDDPALKALVANGVHDYLSVGYMGKRQQMEVRPMPYLMQPAPSLVVFRDENVFSTVNVACMLVFALLVGLFSLPVLAVLIAYVMRSGTYPLADLWPSQAHRARYANIIFAGAFLMLVFALRFRAMKINQTLLAVLAVTIAMLIATLKPNRTVSRIGIATAVTAAMVAVAWGNWILAIAGPALYLLVAAPGSALLRRLQGFDIRFLYVCAALSLLAALVVVPCFGLFRISYNTVNRLALETSQISERDQLVDRAAQADAHFRALKPPGEGKQWLQSYVGRRIAETLDRYDEPVFDPENRAAAANLKPDRPDVSWLQKPIAWASGWFPVNRRGAQLREMAVYEQDHLNQFRSNQVGDDELLDMLAIPDSALPQGVLHGVYPLWGLPWGAGVLMLLLAAVLAYWFYYLARRVFLLDMQDVPPLRDWDPAEPETANLLVIGHPKSGKSGKARGLLADKFDVANAVATGAWFHVFEQSTVVLDQFETMPGDAAIWLHKLELLENLVFVEKKRVIILTAIDPTFFILSANDPELPAPILDRWAAVLSLFEKRTAGSIAADEFRRGLASRFGSCRAELLDMIAAECEHTAQLWNIGDTILRAHYRDTKLISKAQFMEELLERADSYYRLLWANCTKRERLVLFQLANDGWANPKNAPAIQHLQRRGLIVRNSGFHIMNESFCRFVQTAQCPEELAQWEEQQEYSTWSALKLAVSTLALMVGVWLLYAQQDLFQLGIGYIAALGTASGAILTLTKNLRGRGSAPG